MHLQATILHAYFVTLPKYVTWEKVVVFSFNFSRDNICSLGGRQDNKDRTECRPLDEYYSWDLRELQFTKEMSLTVFHFLAHLSRLTYPWLRFSSFCFFSIPFSLLFLSSCRSVWQSVSESHWRRTFQPSTQAINVSRGFAAIRILYELHGNGGNGASTMADANRSSAHLRIKKKNVCGLI